MTVRPDGTYLYMHGKDHAHDNQLWRLEYNGCLRNKKYMDYCLTSAGGVELQMEHEILEEKQRWKFENGYLVTKVFMILMIVQRLNWFF